MHVVLGKEREMKQAVGELETQLRNVTNLLAEFKHRAYMAEVCCLSCLYTSLSINHIPCIFEGTTLLVFHERSANRFTRERSEREDGTDRQATA